MKRPRLAKLRQIARRVADVFPFTLLGLVVLTASYFALTRYGYGKIDLILLVVGGLGLFVGALGLILSAVAAIVTWLWVRGRRSEIPVKVECGFWTESGFYLPSLWFIPFVYLTWTVESPPCKVRQRRKRTRILEEICPERRANTATVVRRFEVGDMLGLVRFAFRAKEERTVRFLPAMGGLRQMQVIHGMSSGNDIYNSEGRAEGDPYDTRRYAPGDPIRFVLWKVFAKTRNLIVRTPERAVSPTKNTVAYLVASDRDEPAAGAARVAVDVGALGPEWRLGADGCATIADSKEEALEVLTQSAQANDQQSGAGLGSFSQKAGRVGRVIVFVPPKPGPWIQRVLASAKEVGAGRVDFIVGTDGVRKRPSRLRRWLARRMPADELADKAADAEELHQVVKALSAGRHRVIVVDRAAGKIFSHAHVAAAAAPVSRPTPVAVSTTAEAKGG
ncbi:MAG: DUF58 domain-containing protein [Myxococcales bacterium]|nr:DUF58 domain-containing protein [Myxococcales bacterium]